MSNARILERKGLIIQPGVLGGNWSNHCQMPTPYLRDDKTLRIFFNSRDRQNQSNVFWVDVDPVPPFRFQRAASRPVLAPGTLGAFDASGVMPTAIVQRVDELWMYYIGWTVRADVPYHNAIGVARSRDGGNTFERFLPGPVIASGPYEPFFCGTGELGRIGDRWVMWYMSATGWRVVNGKPEPRYHLKVASSDDGIVWKQDGRIAVDYVSDDEGGIARATVLKRPNGYQMWYCYRGITNYRGRGANAYRIGQAVSPDGWTWQRLREHAFTAPPQAGAFDEFMECYPAVYECGDRSYIFYNGSDFGQTGIGYATLVESGAA